jgi:cytochrome P450
MIKLFPKMDKLDGDVWTDQRHDITTLTFNTVFRSAFGTQVKTSDEEFGEFIVNVQKQFYHFSKLILIQKLPRAIQIPTLKLILGEDADVPARYKRIVGEWVEQYQRKKAMIEVASPGSFSVGQDFYIDNILAAVEAGKQRRTEAIGDLATVFLAGTHTSQTNLEQALMWAARKPEIQQKAYEEIRSKFDATSDVTLAVTAKLHYLRAFSMEVFRLTETLIHSLHRFVREPIKCEGYVIPAGATIFLNIHSLSRDSELFDDPLEFRPERWLRENGTFNTKMNDKVLIFGVGGRKCPGSAIAGRQFSLVLAHLFLRYEFASKSGKAEDVQFLSFQDFNQLEAQEPLRVIRRK